MLRLATGRGAKRVAHHQRLSLSSVQSQWPSPRISMALCQRSFANARTPDKTILPGSNSTTSAGVPQAPILNPARPTLFPEEISTHAMPKIPPTPEEVAARTPIGKLPTTDGADGRSTPEGNTLPKRPRRRLRRFLLTLFLLSTIGYAGGVYYALVSDNFHDFFTEYVPFGEDTVAYFEDREFRKRFPQREHASRSWAQARGENKVTIGRSSGLSPRLAESSSEDLGQRGRHVSAVVDNKPSTDATQQQPAQASAREKTQAVEKAKAARSISLPTSGGTSSNVTNAGNGSTSPGSKDKTSTESTQDAVSYAEIDRVDNPVVRRLVKMVNDVITAVNASPEATKMSSTLGSLKQELSGIVADIDSLKEHEAKTAETKIQAAHLEFDKAAQELVRRLEQEMREQEAKWREEYEQERERLSNSYQQKLAAELDLADKIAAQKTENHLLQREIELQQYYADSVRAKVEQERGGRLSKLDELSSSVAELQKLTGEWNGVVDSTLQTQHLQVAVEAVRAKVLAAETTVPFVNELVALKEVSKEDDVVNAAIASINPVAYQRGIATTGRLIDRFRRVATEVRKASLLPEDAGIASHAASAVLSRFMFQKKADRGLPEGDDVEATLARTEVLLEEGELDAAAREMNSLKGWAGVLSRDWVRDCRTVLEVRQAVDVISTEARLKSLLVE